MSSERNFQTFPHSHLDIVLAIDYNLYGNRIVTASSDRRIKVWDKKGDAWEGVDEWKAHNAEITDVKWNGPYTGQILGSIAEDNFFNLWEEDISQPPMSTRRFKSIMRPLHSKTRLPWVSLDFKNYNTETYLALITRDGLLSIMEPKDHDNLAGEWSEWFAKDFYVCLPKPARTEETSFRVAFHKEKLPCYSAIAAGVERKALSFVVASMNTARVYRTDGNRGVYLAAELTGSRSLVRDVAWASGSCRGYDVVATGGKDGVVRVYELRAQPGAQVNGTSAPSVVASRRNTVESSKQVSKPTRNAPSGIGAGLAGAAKAREYVQDDEDAPGRVKHVVRLAAELAEHRGAVWSVTFSNQGDLLLSTGDDGTVRSWKRGVDMKWHEYSEIDVTALGDS